MLAVLEGPFARQLQDAAYAAGVFGSHPIEHAEELSAVVGQDSARKGIQLTIGGHRYDLQIGYAGPTAR